MSAALRYHRATNVDAGGTDEDEERFIGERPAGFKDYGDRERLPLEVSLAGPLLQDGAGIVRSQERRDYGGGTIHWRAYSSAGGLFPVDAYVATGDGLYSFDPLSRALVPLADGEASAAVGAAIGVEDAAEALVVLTGIHARTGWKYLERGYRHVWWDAGTMLANLLALAAADDLDPRLYVSFDDRYLNGFLGLDGQSEYALAVLALGTASVPLGWSADAAPHTTEPTRFPLAEAAHAAGVLSGSDAVRSWQFPVEGQEPRLPRDELLAAIRRRSSIRAYGTDPLPRDELADLLAWSEAPIPADAPSVVRQFVTVAAVERLRPGIYDAQLDLIHERDEDELRAGAGFAAMEQDHPKRAAANVFQLADLDETVRRLGDRGYRWAQLEAGIRAGRLQVGAFMRGWGAAASTFYDEEVSKLLETDASPMLMVAVGARGGRLP